MRESVLQVKDKKRLFSNFLCIRKVFISFLGENSGVVGCGCRLGLRCGCAFSFSRSPVLEAEDLLLWVVELS